MKEEFTRADSDEIDIREFKEVTIDGMDDFDDYDTRPEYIEDIYEDGAEGENAAVYDDEAELEYDEYSKADEIYQAEKDEYYETENNESEDEEQPGSSKAWNILAISLGIVIFALIFVVGKMFLGKNSNQDSSAADTSSSLFEIFTPNDPISQPDDPQQTDAAGTADQNGNGSPAQDNAADMNGNDPEDPQQGAAENGAEAQITQETVQTGIGENNNISIGIDVAKYQGTIDWQQVAASGVQFAMIRVGYRTQADGLICEDPMAKYNMQEAAKYGVKIGVYFFSTAVSDTEAIEEADWVADFIARYPITYPVAYNCEGYNNAENRQYNIDRETRSNIAMAFLERISQRGYTPMFYAAKSEIEGNRDWNISSISSRYKIWVSQYPAAPFPETSASSYSGTHAMWQYTNRGSIAGISGNVDLNVAYFSYDNAAQALDSNAPEEVSANVEALMNFTDADETVTAKDVVNLRDRPSQGDDSTVLRTLRNGETAQRTGVSDSGWSRLTIDGQNYYAISSYLTTDISYTTPQQDEDNNAQSEEGIRTQFASVNESVTAKIEVNLRTLPSVTNEDSTVAAVLKNGEWITRTGVSDNGWSRVEYNGQTLYCISSYLMTE